MSAPLNPQQFGEGAYQHVWSPGVYEQSPVTPQTPQPKTFRGPNALRSREGDAGILRGRNPNEVIKEHNDRLREEKIARGEDPDYLDLHKFGMGEHWGRPDPDYVPQWPKARLLRHRLSPN